MTSPGVQFLIAGAHRGGTSAPHACLGDAKGIAMARRKEVHLVDDGRFETADAPGYDGYGRFFLDAANEATPVYRYVDAAGARQWDGSAWVRVTGVLA